MLVVIFEFTGAASGFMIMSCAAHGIKKAGQHCSKLCACARTTFRLARTTFSYWRTIGPGRCCSCSTPPTFVRLLRVSAYRLTSYADDSQLYTWGPLSTVPQQRRRMELGVERIAVRMRSNRLRLNPEKTDFLWCATRRRCIHL